MKKRPFNPLIVGAVVLGLFAVWLIIHEFNSLRDQFAAERNAAIEQMRAELEAKGRKDLPAIIEKEKKRAVVYAKTPIKAGDRIEASMLETKDTPEDLLLAAYTRPEEVVGQFASVTIEVGEPLLPSNVSKQVQRMSVKLTPGMRAISLAVENVKNGTGGFVTDGDWVDVLLTYATGPKLLNGDPVTRTILVLQKVKVLYAPGPDDYRTDQTRSLKVRPTGEIATFEVTPDQAEMLTQLSSMGTFRLILRNRADTIQRRTLGYSATDFIEDESSAQRRANRSVLTTEGITKELRDQNAKSTEGAIPNATQGNP